MVNLILDTNAWIYLANGFNPETNKIEEDFHFQLAEWILKKIEANKCRIFSNYIIKLEWERNREKCNELIKRYENQIVQKKNELKKKRKSPDYLERAKKFRETEKVLLKKIEKNKAHVETIERILGNSIEIPINNEQKLKAVDLAIEKKPPFHHKDNSVADAIIFLSTVDYFFYDEEFSIEDTILVSNNTSDFGESVTNKKLHPELAQMLIDKPIVFETNLAKALDLGEKVIARYQSYLDYLNRDCIACLMDCKGTDYFMAEVEFKDQVEIEIDDEGYRFNPMQLLMDFGEDFNFTVDELKAMDRSRFITIDVGECDFCNARHIRCDCGEEHATYGDYIECGCGKEYSLEEGIKLINKEEA